IDVSAAEVHTSACRRGDSNHEVAGCSGDFERNPHGLIHGQNFHGARADAEQSRKRARAEHQTESCRNSANAVMSHPFWRGKASIQTQARGQGIGNIVSSSGSFVRGSPATYAE